MTPTEIPTAHEPLTIGVDAREICDRPAGRGQYLLRLLAFWSRRADCRLVLYTLPGQTLPEAVVSEQVRHIQVGGKAVLWHRSAARRLRGDGVRVFFAALSYQSALWNPIPTITVVHDLAIFRLPRLAHNRRSQIVEHLTLRRSIRASSGLIAVSESTKRDLIELMSAPSDKIEVIHEAPLINRGRRTIPLPYSEREAYFLFTSTLEPRKNIGALFQAYAALPDRIRGGYRLKLAGKSGWGGEDYPKMARDLNIEGRVDFLGYVDDDRVAHLFSHAVALIYPSWYEGFGLPVIEAMAVGTPVVTSNTSSLPELVGPEGLALAPDDPQGMALAMERLVNDPTFYEKQSAYLFERAAGFSWEDAAEATLQMLRSAALRFTG